MDLHTICTVFCVDALRSLALLVLVMQLCIEQDQHLFGWLRLVVAVYCSLPSHHVYSWGC